MHVLSTIEAEYITGASIAQEVVWLRSLLVSLKVVPDAYDPVRLHTYRMFVIDYLKYSKYKGGQNILGSCIIL